jgi:hypothetical protein
MSIKKLFCGNRSFHPWGGVSQEFGFVLQQDLTQICRKRVVWESKHIQFRVIKTGHKLSQSADQSRYFLSTTSHFQKVFYPSDNPTSPASLSARSGYLCLSILIEQLGPSKWCHCLRLTHSEWSLTNNFPLRA